MQKNKNNEYFKTDDSKSDERLEHTVRHGRGICNWLFDDGITGSANHCF